jgi:uncharacterized membrane protein
MPDVDGQSRADELDERLARLEAEVSAQRAEIDSLRAEVVGRSRGIPAERPAALRFREPGVEAVLAAPAIAVKVEAHRSLENRIGSQLFNRVGIVALLIGVAWFLKLAIDNHWIHPTPAVRVIFGLLVGAAIVVWSERFRRKGYDVFSYSLKAVGMGMLYLTLWASFQLYHLLPASVALIAMIGVTAWNAFMAWTQDSELLAVYAAAGGFATPALLGSGGNHEVFIFTYLFAIDAAVLLLLAKKPWQRLLLGSLPGTAAYFTAWYVEFFRAGEAGVTGFFVVLLAAPFIAVALIGRQREDFGEGLLAPLAAATFLALGLYSVLQDSGCHAWLPWVAVLLAAVYLALMWVRRNGVAEAVHLAIAVIFLTVAIPLKAEGQWITVGWLAEGVALIGVAAKLLGPEIQPRVRALMCWLGCGALVLGVGDSPVFWFHETASRDFWNAQFATELSAIAAVALAAWMAFTPAYEDAAPAFYTPKWREIAAACLVGFNLLVVLTGVREILTCFGRTGDAGLAEAATISAWLMVYAAAMLAVGFWRRMAFLRWQGLGLLVFTIGKVFLYDMRTLSSGYRVLSFIGLGVLLMTVSFAYQRDWLKLRDDELPVEESAP